MVTDFELENQIESGMQNFSQMNISQKQEIGISDPHDPNVLFVNTPGKQTPHKDLLLKILS